ncbi:putative ER lumen protein retaining receptor 1 [Neospora caninum Liverpool]|uniref:ER lumen protein retaining receptor 1, putative n=1 Tax=Neospora caninum (strain Liverpool) TaxID=572307 RepID=F0VAU0_NEOCL|nr:putative ER lumen protein retaining receptor 1 [Neospora caninum Liverpool]CBZ51348.1 putative ER lumen protein retaining receptor 1 [Neospora caninum Liverpool]CEL68665.1 TPA: ER lumen protein retaining receptor 1, putative [Neospora caninum Liverpool]|eukprot:XP_003881381.1 putative ER lumen protein retaining receptor 1 [Neospora caninum Liverpool]
MEVWLFILGYLIHFVASCVLVYKIHQQRTVYGLSIDTQICFLAASLSRCVWYLDTRLVETWLAYLELLCSTVISVVLTYYLWRYRHTNTKTVWTPCQAAVIIPVSMLTAFFIHPGRQWWTVQILVAFSIYTEAIEPLTSHYVGLLVLSRVVRLFFWVTLYFQGEHFLGLFLADLLHSVLAADYFVMWCRKLRHGGALIYKI